MLSADYTALILVFTSPGARLPPESWASLLLLILMNPLDTSVLSNWSATFYVI